MGNAIPNRKLRRIHHTLSFRSVARLLNQRALSAAMLAEALEVSRTTALKWIQLLHARSPGQHDNLVYVAFWRKPPRPGYPCPFYAWSYGEEDAPKPLPTSRAESCRKWRQKKAREVEAKRVSYV